MHKVTVIRGDGIGPEIVDSTVRVLDATGVPIAWEERVAGQCAIEEYGCPVPEVTLDSIRRTGVALKGPFTNVVGKGFPSPNQTLRTKLGLYGNLRLAKTFEGVKNRFSNVDLVIVRECTEDVYAGVEQKIGDDAAVAIKCITRSASTRIVQFAFDYAVKERRKKVTVVLKANMMKLTDGLFLESARDVAKKYPSIPLQEMNVDAQCMDLVRKPEEVDVLVMPNLYGDIIADLAGGLVGSIGLCPGGNFGDGIAVFESAHGSVPKNAGLNKANPAAMILSGAMMLHYLNEKKAALAVENAVKEVIKENETVTYDLGGSATTEEMTDSIIWKIKTM